MQLPKPVLHCALSLINTLSANTLPQLRTIRYESAQQPLLNHKQKIRIKQAVIKAEIAFELALLEQLQQFTKKRLLKVLTAEPSLELLDYLELLNIDKPNAMAKTLQTACEQALRETETPHPTL